MNQTSLNDWKESRNFFIYFSQVYCSKVLDISNKSVGRLVECLAEHQEPYPLVKHYLIQSRGKLYKADEKDISKLLQNQVLLNCLLTELKEFNPDDYKDYIFLRRDLLDKQMVDTAGCKVVRVNDLHFLKKDTGHLLLVHVDVGIKGLFRRLGWEPFIDFIMVNILKKKEYITKETLVSWKYIQMLPSKESPFVKVSLTQKQLSEMHPADLADIIEELDDQHRNMLFKSLDVETAAETLSEVDQKMQATLIESLSDEAAADIIEEMPPDKAADLLGDLSEEKANVILEKMEQEEKEDALELLEHEEDTAGGLMTTEYLSYNLNMSAGNVLESFKEDAVEVESAYYVYVVDDFENLCGVVSLKDLILAKKDEKISEIMETSIKHVGPYASKDEVANLIARYNLITVPVIQENKLIGVVTFDDILDLFVPSVSRRKKLKKG